MMIALQVITIVILVASLVTGVVNTISENKKDRLVDIVIEQRVINLEALRAQTMVLLRYRQIVCEQDIYKSCIDKCMLALSRITVVLNEIYHHEQKVINSGC